MLKRKFDGKDLRIVKKKINQILSKDTTFTRQLWKSKTTDEQSITSNQNVRKINDENIFISDDVNYDNNEKSIVENDENEYNIEDQNEIVRNDDFDDDINCNDVDVSADIDINCNDVDVSAFKMFSRLDRGIPSEYDQFNIINYTQSFLNDCKKKRRDNNDSNLKVSNEAEVTKEECALMFSSFFASENISEKTGVNLFIMLNKMLPTMNWPINIINGNTYLKLEDYSGEDNRTLQFDACTNNCIVFVGCNKKSMTCPVCKADRFSTCPKCYKKKSYESCNHFYDRTAFSKIWYRPLTSLIPYLLSKNLFLKSINYVGLNNNAYLVSDVRTGTNYKRHYEEMCDIFNTKKNTIYKNINGLVMVNLLLSEFYDGMQVYKSRIQSFWPLMISILNLPLSMRNKPGVGSFLVALFLGKLNK
jgi:hypothetical protein